MDIGLLASYFSLFFVLADGLIPTYAHRKPTKVGVILEYCGKDHDVLSDVASDIASNLTSAKPSNRIAKDHTPIRVWTIGCHDYGQTVARMSDVSESGVDRLVVAASRETLRLVDSILSSPSSVRSATFIATNNELTAGYEHAMITDPNRRCADQAGGREFWTIIANLLLDVIDSLQWRNLYLYVDEIYGLSGARLVRTAFEAYRRVASLNLVMNTDVSEFLRRLTHFERGAREVKAVVIVCGRQETLDIVKQAADLGLFSTFYRWLIFESGSENLLANLRLQYDTDVIFIRHVGNKTLKSSVLQAIASGPRWSDVANRTCSSAANGIDKKLQVVGKRDRLHLSADVQLEVLRARRRVNLIPSLVHIGTWSASNGLADLRAGMIPNMDGVVLQVVALHCPPYVIVQKGFGGNVTFEGYLVDLMSALGKIMNFKFNITLPFDHTYGRCEEGHCTGIIGFLVRKEADLALANLTPTGARAKLMDFSATPIDKAGLSILFKRPTKSDDNIINAYFMPFSMPVSVCVGVTIPVLGILLYTTLRFGSRMTDNVFEEESDGKDPIQARHNRSLGRCLFAALQSFGQQGIDVIPKTGSGRAVFGVMWLFSLFVISAYTANLISYFTATFISMPFRSFEEMFLSRKYRIGFMKGTTYLDDIQGANSTLLMRVWSQMEKQRFSTMVDDLDEGIERVRSERYIFVHEARVLEHIVSKDCEFTTMNELYLSAPMLLAFQKDSQFRRPISEMLLMMTESGLIQKLKNQWWPPTIDCVIAAQTFQSISLWGVTSIMAVLAGGMLVGTVVMLLEKCFKAQRQRALLLRSTIVAGSSHILGQIGADRVTIPISSLRLRSPVRFGYQSDQPEGQDRQHEQEPDGNIVELQGEVADDDATAGDLSRQSSVDDVEDVVRESVIG